jgi:hypothetical protein
MTQVTDLSTWIRLLGRFFLKIPAVAAKVFRPQP